MVVDNIIFSKLLYAYIFLKKVYLIILYLIANGVEDPW